MYLVSNFMMAVYSRMHECCFLEYMLFRGVVVILFLKPCGHDKTTPVNLIVRCTDQLR